MNQEEMLKLTELPKLTKKDTFTFGCNQCGKCCKNRDGDNAIMLTPLDVFKIAKYLKMEVGDFLRKYCVGYCGEYSKLPIAILKAKAYEGVCPFFKNECTIHSVKPAVCALFPLDRMSVYGTKELSYFKQPDVLCGNKTKHTVEEWLSEFNMLEEEKFTILWQQKTGDLSIPLIKLYEKHPNSIIGDFIFLGAILYMNYDTEKDFMPQFEDNCRIATKVLEKAKTLKEIKDWS